MLLVIAERVNNRRLTDAKVARWRATWEEHGWKAAMLTPAMTHGASRKRLDQFLPGDKEIVNLLPPDNKPGTWDAELARRTALQSVGWLTANADVHGVVLLGRRVLDTYCNLFRDTTIKQAGRRCVGLPHPSGRSHYWNDPEAMERVRAYVTEFENAQMDKSQVDREA